MAGYVAISGQITGTPFGTQQIGPLTITPNGSNDFTTETITLSNGNTVLTVPSWAVGVIIQPPTANSNTITLKGGSSDAGIQISPTAPTVMSFAASAVATFVLTASASTAGTQITFF